MQVERRIIGLGRGLGQKRLAIDGISSKANQKNDTISYFLSGKKCAACHWTSF